MNKEKIKKELEKELMRNSDIQPYFDVMMKRMYFPIFFSISREFKIPGLTPRILKESLYE